MKIEVAAKEYLVEIEVRKFTKKTIRSYRNNLNLFFHSYIKNDIYHFMYYYEFLDIKKNYDLMYSDH